MPLFFLLSGFCLTLGYGKNKYSKISGCCSSSSKAKILDSTQQCIGNIFDSATFYFGRLTRVLPVYYVCFLYSLPLSIAAWYFASGNPEIPKEHLYALIKEIIGGSISALFVVQSWLIEFGLGPNGAAWTISTLFFFYLVYPRYVFVIVVLLLSRRIDIFMSTLSWFFNLFSGFWFLHKIAQIMVLPY